MKLTSNKFGRLLLACGLFAVSPLAAAGQCQPSRWVPDDEIGAANHVSPEQVLLDMARHFGINSASRVQCR